MRTKKRKGEKQNSTQEKKNKEWEIKTLKEAKMGSPLLGGGH